MVALSNKENPAINLNRCSSIMKVNSARKEFIIKITFEGNYSVLWKYEDEKTRDSEFLMLLRTQQK